ncbi:MAG TPA: hypothetical protein DCR14_02960 [Acidimicrobiaceae bacterium]|nr:hypothetical protein [Acidimicrobiaceae bacterium]
MKDMKDTVAAAPGMVNQAQQMAANAQAMQAQMMAQQQASMQQAMAYQQANAGAAAASGGLEPIAGVGLEQYARIVKAIAPLNYDQSLLPGIAASHGVDGASWQAAHDGWNARIQGDPNVAKAFSDVYRSV